jgi:hypothetical protein
VDYIHRDDVVDERVFEHLRGGLLRVPGRRCTSSTYADIHYPGISGIVIKVLSHIGHVAVAAIARAITDGVVLPLHTCRIPSRLVLVPPWSGGKTMASLG